MLLKQIYCFLVGKTNGKELLKVLHQNNRFIFKRLQVFYAKLGEVYALVKCILD